MPKDPSPSFDIQQPTLRTQGMHSSTKFVLGMSILVVLLGGGYIALRIKEKRAYEAYLRTPEGQLRALEATSDPVTATPEERAQVMKDLEKSSGQSTLTHQDYVKSVIELE